MACADDLGDSQWPIENVPDADDLYMRVLHSHIVNGKVNPQLAFRVRGEGDQRGMSTDWSKYSTPEETRGRVRSGRSQDDYGVLRMNVGEVRGIPNQLVKHRPLDNNRAHTDVTGPVGSKTEVTKIRYLFSRICAWAIRCDA